MKKFLKSKNQLIIFIIAFAIFASSVGFFIFKFNKNIDIVRAGTGDNVSGFAWNSNIGWISFNSTDCDIDGDGTYEGVGESGAPAPAGCPAAGAVNDYGVNIDPTTGNFSGYAWSNNIGWISFAGGDTPPDSFAFSANCDDPTDCDGISDNCTACYNSTNNNVYGWARNANNDDSGIGWIKLGDPTVGDTTFPIPFPIPLPLIFGSAAYSVSIDSATGDFSGWAWNANDDDSGIGWISFNCADEGVCATSDYKVSLLAVTLEQPVITSVVPVPGFQCSKLIVNWNDVDDEGGYYVYRSGVSPFTPDNDINRVGVLLAGVESFIELDFLSAGEDYYYIVRAYKGLDFSDSEIARGDTLSVCEVSNVVAEGVCPGTIELSWLVDDESVHYEVQRCNETDSECTNEIFSAFIAGDDCFEPITNSCIDDTIFNLAEIEDYFQYRIRAIGALGEVGDWSDLSEKEFACFNMPTWQEVK